MPETTAYLILGLVVTFVILGGYVASLVTRRRGLQKDLRLIEQLRQEQ
jgi:CcmD family protein